VPGTLAQVIAFSTSRAKCRTYLASAELCKLRNLSSREPHA
jgi:hypothetical protein